MNTITLFLGKIIAPYLFVTGLGFFLSDKFYINMINNANRSDPVLINLSGMVHFFIGITIVTNHFLWSNILEVLISLVGFMFLLKGIFLILLPSLTLKSNKAPSIKRLHLMGFGFILLGLIVGYLSFFA